MSFNKAWVREDFNRAAPVYDQYTELSERAADLLLGEIMLEKKSTANILDLGAGTGILASAANHRSWHWLQLDLSEAMCDMAQEIAQTIQGDMELLPFKKNSFDVICSSLALQWCNTPLAVFKESYRCLKRGGQMVMTTLSDGTLKELQLLSSAIDGSSRVSEFLSKADIANFLKEAGFKYISVSEHPLTLYYPNLLDLLKRMRAMGASNKQSSRGAPVKPSHMAKLISEYEQKFSILQNNKKQVFATWNILLISGIKP